MVVLTGATGLVGSALLRRLLAQGEQVRVLVRDPRRLGPDRVRVQITLGDLSNPVALRQLVRGASAVVHLAATIRDQPAGSIEELNGLATARLLRHAEAAGAERFVFFGAMGATPELAHAVLPREGARRARRDRLPSGRDRAVALDRVRAGRPLAHAPEADVAAARDADHRQRGGARTSRSGPRTSLRPRTRCCARALPGAARRLELAGPEILTYEEIVRLALSAWDRDATARARPALDGAARPAAARADVRPVGVRHLGGGGADGGADGHRGRHARRAQPRRWSRSGWQRCSAWRAGT